MKHLNITVKGRVQGVWFRASTRDEAQRLGINGFVENRPDGSVYLEAEGDEHALAQLLGWLETGPPLARVDALDVDHADFQALTGFDIRS